MKNKIILIILSIIFIGLLFGIHAMLKNQVNSYENDQQIANIKEENMSVLEITKNNFEEEVLKSEKTVLVDFYADWCGPCKMLSPIVDEIAKENEEIKVCRINVDKEEDLAVKYGIMSIPTLVAIKNGEEVERKVGVIGKDEILEMLK